MLIYLDANLVQYCADYQDFLFGEDDNCPITESVFRGELLALRELIRLEQYGNWELATSPLLLKELYRGKPTADQLATYALLRESFSEDEWPTAEAVQAALHTVVPVAWRNRADGQHLATAAAMGASWFLTNDSALVDAARDLVPGVRVARPSECLGEISVGLFLR